MYQPGMVYQFAQVYYNDMLRDAAAARRQATVGAVAPAARKRQLLLTAAAALTVCMAWVLIAH